MRPSVLWKTEASAWSLHSAHSKHDDECVCSKKRVDIRVGGRDCTLDK